MAFFGAPFDMKMFCTDHKSHLDCLELLIDCALRSNQQLIPDARLTHSKVAALVVCVRVCVRYVSTAVHRWALHCSVCGY